MSRDVVKLDLDQVRESAKWRKKGELPRMQVAVYVMCGGGYIGHLAAEQPADFYIDDRVGRRPYSKREIYQAVKVLETMAKAWGFNPHRLPEMPGFHNMGVF